MEKLKDNLEETNQNQVIVRRKLCCDTPVNPFVNSLQLTSAQKIQVIVMSIFVAPFRLFMVVIAFTLCYLFSLIVSIGVAKPAIEPVGRVRITLFNAFGKLGRVLFFCAGFYHIQVKGDRAKNVDAPLLIVAPHTSMMDMFVFFATSPLPSGLSAEKFGYLPILGTLCKPLQPLFVSRANSQSKERLALQIRHRVKSPGSWPQLVIYPEGTCTNGRSLITFKLGAFVPGVPVQPVVIQYLNAYDSFSWSVGSPNPIILMWLSLCQFSVQASIAYLPTYYPDEDEQSDPKLYANNVRAVIAKAAGLPCTEHSYEDCRLMWKAESLNLPLTTGTVEYTVVNQKLGINYTDIEERLLEFSDIVTDRASGVASLEDFAKYLNVPLTYGLQKLFGLYDDSNAECINFKDYLLGFYLISKPAANDNNLKIEFDFYDADGTGKISKKQFHDAISGAFGVGVVENKVFSSILNSSSDSITFEEFRKCLGHKTEYAKLFQFYRSALPHGTNEKFNDVFKKPIVGPDIALDIK